MIKSVRMVLAMVPCICKNGSGYGHTPVLEWFCVRSLVSIKMVLAMVTSICIKGVLAMITSFSIFLAMITGM